MEIMIVRKDDTFTSQAVKAALERQPDWDRSISLEVRSVQGLRLRSIDPTVLVAIVSAAGSIVGNLIVALLQLVRQRGLEKVVLEFGDKRRIEIEAKEATKVLPELIKMLESAELKRIII
jgi:hypothetical protein